MIRRSTWITIILLLLAIGAYFLIKNSGSRSVIEPTPTVIGNSYLLDISKDKLQSIRVFDRQNKSTLIARDSTGAWIITLPSAGEADQALAEAAETQIGALLILTSLETPPPLTDMGLDMPAFTIQLSLMSGANHTIEVGNKIPTGSGYYVRLDEKSISVIGTNGIEPLTNLLNNPPFAATRTPDYTQTPTDTLMTATPSLTATP